MQDRIVIGGEISLLNTIDGEIILQNEVDGEAGVFFGMASDPYTGETTITPTEETQTLNTAGKTVAVDIIIEPIPENYGLITWNGSTLTVS